jgi:hypothetical protein
LFECDGALSHCARPFSGAAGPLGAHALPFPRRAVPFRQRAPRFPELDEVPADPAGAFSQPPRDPSRRRGVLLGLGTLVSCHGRIRERTTYAEMRV